MSRVATTRSFSFSTSYSFDIAPSTAKDSNGDQGQHISRGAEDSRRRIHILGIGNVGTFIAHSLAGIPNRPPLTLFLRRWERLRDYRGQGSALRLTTHDMTETRHGFDIEAPEVPTPDPNQSTGMPFASHSDQYEHGKPLSQTRSKESRSLRGKPPTETGDADANSTIRKTHATDALAEDRRPMRASYAPGLDSQYPDTDDPISLDEFLEENSNLTNRGVSPNHSHGEQADVIHHLIVTVKAHHTVTALLPYKHRLNSQSTILFVQNGMGMIDEVNRDIFPYEDSRPHYMVGILSHGLYGRGPFDVVHAGDGTMALGLLIEGKDYPSSSRYLLRTLTRTPVFVAVGFPATDLIQQQLDKLAVNAVLNPLTAILNCRNGQVLDNFFVTRVMRLLLAEISVVVRSLPELKNVPNVNMRFDSARLESLVVKVAQLTGKNHSSMLQDVRNGRQTEIDYINGYIIRRGEELGIHCVTNYMLMHMVKAKDKINEEERGVVPLQPSLKPSK